MYSYSEIALIHNTRHVHTRFRVDGIKAMSLVNRINGRRVCLHCRKGTTIYSCKMSSSILGDPAADSEGEGKCKRAGKYGTKKSKERPEEPLGTMSYQTSSKRSPPFWLLIGQKNTKIFWHQSETRTAVTVWNWSGKTLSPGALLAVLYFSSCHIFPPVETFPWLHYLPLDLRGWSRSSCDKLLRHF